MRQGRLWYVDERTVQRDDAALARYDRQHWRSRQISDHDPVRVSLHIDDAEPFLERKGRDLVGA
ncbi:MAG: hypothetical protein MUF73_01440 [Rhodobacteraceae bacterium]|jgi:hypothetical protein|nr:hypothetical protein [Paracoccaceae bacterium]